jgi:hypothetical protein
MAWPVGTDLMNSVVALPLEHEPAGSGQRCALQVTATMQRDGVRGAVGWYRSSNEGSEQDEEPESSS